MVDGENGREATDPSEVDVEEFLAATEFDVEESFLTRRQAEVLLMREYGLKQTTIAQRLGTSRANVSNVEASARENIEKARETVAFADLLAAPVRVAVPVGTDLYDVPEMVFDACDEAGVKVSHSAPDLMKLVSDAAGAAIEGREVRERLSVSVATDGTVRVRTP